MAKQYTVNITNGVGTAEILSGTYNVTANVPGYENTSISPKSLTVTSTENEYNLTIAATGSLTLHVTDTGTTSGNPIVGATFYRTDSLGNTYGDVITTDSNGIATFQNVPYAETGAPTIYFKQTGSDSTHDFDQTVKNTRLTTQTATLEIENPTLTTKTFNLTDANYTGLVIGSGTLTLDE